MRVIEARNVHVALAQGIHHLLKDGEDSGSRNGDVLVSPAPVCTVYHSPLERVLFGATRDANPFFHLMESLWMLAGRNDLAFPQQFNKRFGEYSDDGKTVHGAYGHRWRAHFGYDQLEVIARELRSNPASRRCVLEMWDATPLTNPASDAERYGANDLNLAMSGGKDVPCNTHIYFRVNAGKLDMTVCCRSNDIIWGAYGANVVHMSILMEYMAALTGLPVGNYYQISNNYHAYVDVYDRVKLKHIADESIAQNLYIISDTNPVTPFPLVSVPVSTWNNDLADFLEDPLKHHNYSDTFFNRVAVPMYAAWAARKSGQGNGLAQIEGMASCDWKVACTQWIERREARNGN